MTVDQTIAKLTRESELAPLVRFLSKGRGFTLEEFCGHAKFTAPKLTRESLLRIVRGHTASTPCGTVLPDSLAARIQKASGPILASVIEAMNGVPAGKLADRKRQLLHYLVHREFPVMAKKKSATKRTVPKLDPQDLIEGFGSLKERARQLSVSEIDREFDALFKKKGCTVAVIRPVLKAEGLDATGTKAALLDRLRRIPRTLAGDRARESFA